MCDLILVCLLGRKFFRKDIECNVIHIPGRHFFGLKFSSFLNSRVISGLSEDKLVII